MVSFLATVAVIVVCFGICAAGKCCLDVTFEGGGVAALGRGIGWLIGTLAVAALILYGFGASFGVRFPGI